MQGYQIIEFNEGLSRLLFIWNPRMNLSRKNPLFLDKLVRIPPIYLLSKPAITKSSEFQKPSLAAKTGALPQIQLGPTVIYLASDWSEVCLLPSDWLGPGHTDLAWLLNMSRASDLIRFPRPNIFIIYKFCTIFHSILFFLGPKVQQALHVEVRAYCVIPSEARKLCPVLQSRFFQLR